jgi:hypothetical protein
MHQVPSETLIPTYPIQGVMFQNTVIFVVTNERLPGIMLARALERLMLGSHSGGPGSIVGLHMW